MPCCILQASSEEIFKTIKLRIFQWLSWRYHQSLSVIIVYGPILSCILLDQVSVTKERVSVL